MIRIADIKREVANLYGLPVAILQQPDGCGGSRERQYVRPRQVGMYLAHKFICEGKQRSRASLQAIGRQFGDRDHTTVLHGCRVIERLMEGDTEERRAVGEVGLRLIEREL